MDKKIRQYIAFRVAMKKLKRELYKPFYAILDWLIWRR